MPEPSTLETRPPSGRGLFLAVTAVGLVLAFVAVIVVVMALRDGGETVTFTVEPGTGDRLARGEQVELMPAEVHLEVGDTLVLRNDDDRPYMIGPYFVRAGETVEQRFTRPQTLVGACELSGHGEFTVVVTGRAESRL